MNSVEAFTSKARTGIWGLDDILSGGFSREHLFLLEGAPGTGKTTIALQFLMAGARAGEKCLYITLSETERELRDGAASHGWALDDGIEVFELLPPESLLDSEQQQSLLYSSDLELGETTKQIFEAVERARPTRVVLDSLSEISAALAKTVDRSTRAHLEGARDQIAKILDPKFAPPSGGATGAVRVFGEQLDPFLTPPDQLGTCWPDYVIRP